jgi:hypothetical protein
MSIIIYLILCVTAAGEYDYAIAFQERIRIPDDKMDYYKDLAEMYVGDDVSPDFYGWVFPKYDHVAVGETPPIYLAACHCVLDTVTHPLYMVQGGEVVLRKTKRRASRQNPGPDLVACMHAGTGTVINKSGIKQYQQATRDRSKVQPFLCSSSIP